MTKPKIHSVHINGGSKHITAGGSVTVPVGSKTDITGTGGYSGPPRGGGVKSGGVSIEHRPNDRVTISGGVNGNNRGGRGAHVGVGFKF